jgi:hypothetical protein
MLQDHEVRDLYFETIHSSNAPVDAAGEAAAPAVTLGDSGIGNFFTDILDDDQKKTVADTVDQVIVMDEIQIFRDRIISYWRSRLRKVMEDPDTREMMMVKNDSDLTELSKELYKGISRCSIDQKLEDELRKASAFVNTDREAMAWKQGSLAANIVNSYVRWLGLDPQSPPAERTVSFNNKEHQLFNRPAHVDGLPPLQEQPSTYIRDYALGWAFALRKLIIDNIQYQGGGRLSLEENARLGKIVTVLQQPFIEERP